MEKVLYCVKERGERRKYKEGIKKARKRQNITHYIWGNTTVIILENFYLKKWKYYNFLQYKCNFFMKKNVEYNVSNKFTQKSHWFA